MRRVLAAWLVAVREIVPAVVTGEEPTVSQEGVDRPTLVTVPAFCPVTERVRVFVP